MDWRRGRCEWTTGENDVWWEGEQEELKDGSEDESRGKSWELKTGSNLQSPDTGRLQFVPEFNFAHSESTKVRGIQKIKRVTTGQEAISNW